MSLAGDINTFIQRTNLRGATVVRKLALDALRGVIVRSPVDTGRFRCNWRVGIAKIDTSIDEGGKDAAYDRSGGPALQAGLSIIAGVKWGDNVFVSNSLPYAEALENGHSQQAPNGMLAVTFAQIRASVARYAAIVQNNPGAK